MIIVLGHVVVRDEHVEQALALSLEHVRRSRLEPGCLEHGVSRDAEAGNRLVFVEKWASMEALRAHFRVSESRRFVESLAAWSSGPPTMQIFEATETSPRASG